MYTTQKVQRKEELERELKKLIEKLKKDDTVKKVILFGSLARGNGSCE